MNEHYPSPDQDSFEIDLIKYWQVIKKNWPTFIVVFMFVMVAVFAVTAYQKKLYLAKVVILPLGGGEKGGGGGMAMLSQLTMGIPLIGGLGGGAEKRIQLFLKSRSFGEYFVLKHDLIKKFYPSIWDEPNKKYTVDEKTLQNYLMGAASRIAGKIKIEPDLETGAQVLSFVDTDPDFTFFLGTNIPKDLILFMKDRTYTDSKRSRVLLKEQLEAVRRDLLETGKMMAEFYKSKDVSSSNPKVDVNLSIEDVQDRVVTSDQSDADLGKTPNPKLEELQALNEKLKKKLMDPNIVSNVPQQVYLEYLAVRREVVLRMNGLITQQYESAKINEIQDEVSFEVVDSALKPEAPFSPNLTLNLSIGFFLASFISIFVVFVRNNKRNI